MLLQLFSYTDFLQNHFFPLPHKKQTSTTKNKITMRKLFLSLAALSVFTMFAFSFGGDETPAPVKASFAKLYPNITKVKWGKENANYEAEFEVNKVETSCLFDDKGSLLETETAIEVSALPKAASDYVSKNFPGEKIKEAAKIIDSKKVVTYEAEVNAGDLIFDSNGKFIKKVVEKKDEEDKK